jgi:hypothetical protein
MYNALKLLPKKVAANAASATAVSPDTPNVLQAMMQLEQAKTRAKSANKFALETEKEKDGAEQTLEELKRHLQPKRVHTHDDAGDAHEVLTEVDNWDLSVHRREATRVQNRRDTQVGSRENQPTPRTGKDGLLNHTRLVLVGWISYWSCGDSAQAVIILVSYLSHRKWYRIVFLQVTNDKKHDCWSSQTFASRRLEFYDIFHKKGLDETLKFAWNDEAETERKEAALMTDNTRSASAPAGTATSGSSIQGQTGDQHDPP